MSPGDPTRLRVAQYVRANPGAHFREVQRALGLSTGQAMHHLRRLLADGTLAAARDAGFVRYYPVGFPAELRAAVGALRLPARRAMAEMLVEGPRTVEELRGASRRGTASTRHHLRGLGRAGAVAQLPGMRGRYALTAVGGGALAFLRSAAPPLAPVPRVEVGPAAPPPPAPMVVGEAANSF